MSSVLSRDAQLTRGACPPSEEHWLTVRSIDPPPQWKTMYLVRTEGSFECECAENNAGRIVCRDCKPKQPSEVTDLTLQTRLKAVGLRAFAFETRRLQPPAAFLFLPFLSSLLHTLPHYTVYNNAQHFIYNYSRP